MMPENIESRLIETEQLAKLRDTITCAICFQIITEDRAPVECNQCQSQLFCRECIESWLEQNEICPLCRKPGSDFNPANPIVMKIISNLQFTCINKERGCEEKLYFRDILKHEKSECVFKKKIELTKHFRLSKRAKQCKVCKCNVHEENDDQQPLIKVESTASNEERKSIARPPTHICSKKERELWCKQHQFTGSYYTANRIQNQDQLGGDLFESFKCELCKNLLKKPMTCKNCFTNFCRVCIANELLLKNECPQCSKEDPELAKMPRNVLNLISKFRITCKNELCETVCDAGSDLRRHELACAKCPNCKLMCNSCKGAYLPADKEAHKCPPKPASLNNTDRRNSLVAEPLLGNNDFNYAVAPRQGYCRQMEDDVSEHISQCNYIFAMVWLVLDVIQLYAYYFLVIMYYVESYNYSHGFRFINGTVQRAYLAFMIIHGIFTYIPTFFTTLATIGGFEPQDGGYMGCCGKLMLLIYSLFQMLWLRIGFGGSLYLDYSTAEDNKISFCVSRCLQMFTHVILIVIVCINNDGLETDPSIHPNGSLLKWATVGVQGFQFVFNLVTFGVLFA